ncbi:IclR family transcriptional regulator [Mesorhizobium sp. ANAO-SY3R2]|uniref:IclR family transcriptional regulator n=1 Tax=Mesorhizobium sp. ANAO-SY3R2 TaxID=3166644 RepID=UPI00366B21B2
MFLAHASVEDDSSTVKSARRALQILEYMKEIRRPAGTTDIAMALSCPISSTSALLKSLASLGYLLFDRRSRTYQASVRVGLLGGWSYEGALNPVDVDNVMERLADETSCAVFLATRNDIHVQYVKVVPGRQRLALPAIGTKLYLTQTAAGMLMMTVEEDHVIEKMVRRMNAEMPSEQGKIGVRETVERIGSMRARGYAQVAGEGARSPCVVAKLIGAQSTQLLAMGILASREEFSSRAPSLVNALDDAVSSLSPMGHQDFRVVS